MPLLHNAERFATQPCHRANLLCRSLVVLCFALPLPGESMHNLCLAVGAIPSRCKVPLYRAFAVLHKSLCRHALPLLCLATPNIVAAMLGFAYIALALLCSTQRCLCFATFSAAEPCRCTTELCHATLYHCLVMLLYTLPLPHYSLLRSTLPLRYISVLHDAAPYLSFTKHSHCFSEQLTTLPLRRSEVQDYAVALPRKPRLCRTLAQST